MFISCTRDLMNLHGASGDELVQAGGRTVSFKTLFLLFTGVSEDPPEVIN
jgi:hypothetical protein